MLPAVRDAARGLARDRGFTLLASALLALTIGTTIAIYAVVDAIVLRPFALARQDRLVVIWEGYSGRDSPVVEVALGEVDDWRQHSQSFESLAVFGSVNLQLTIGDGSARARVPYAVVSSPFFSVAGTPPLLGRVFEAGDELGTRARTVVLSHDLWMRGYGADPLAVGRRLEVQSEPDEPMRSLEIIGVMPAGFDFPRGAGLWLPAAPGLREIGERFGNPDQMVANFKIFYALGRLRDGVSAMTAQHELTSVIHQLQPARASAAAPDATVLPIDRYLLGPTRPVLWTLLAAAVLMLAIACANIAGLHVFRAARQDRALATRLALGASHAQLVQQSLCESVLLAVAGSVGAGLVAWLTSHVLILAAPVDIPRLSSITLVAPGVFAMNVGLVGAATILSGLWPAMFAGRLDAGRYWRTVHEPPRIGANGASSGCSSCRRLLLRWCSSPERGCSCGACGSSIERRSASIPRISSRSMSNPIRRARSGGTRSMARSSRASRRCRRSCRRPRYTCAPSAGRSATMFVPSCAGSPTNGRGPGTRSRISNPSPMTTSG